MQHRWAELSEKLDDKFPGVKYGAGPPDIRDSLVGSSARIREVEEHKHLAYSFRKMVSKVEEVLADPQVQGLPKDAREKAYRDLLEDFDVGPTEDVIVAAERALKQLRDKLDTLDASIAASEKKLAESVNEAIKQYGLLDTESRQ